MASSCLSASALVDRRLLWREAADALHVSRAAGASELRAERRDRPLQAHEKAGGRDRRSAAEDAYSSTPRRPARSAGRADRDGAARRSATCPAARPAVEVAASSRRAQLPRCLRFAARRPRAGGARRTRAQLRVRQRHGQRGGAAQQRRASAHRRGAHARVPTALVVALDGASVIARPIAPSAPSPTRQVAALRRPPSRLTTHGRRVVMSLVATSSMAQRDVEIAAARVLGGVSSTTSAIVVPRGFRWAGENERRP